MLTAILGNLTKQGLPVCAFVFFPDVFKQLSVTGRRILAAGMSGRTKRHVIGMCVQEHHPPVFGHPVDLAFPDADGALA